MKGHEASETNRFRKGGLSFIAELLPKFRFVK